MLLEIHRTFSLGSVILLFFLEYSCISKQTDVAIEWLSPIRSFTVASIEFNLKSPPRSYSWNIKTTDIEEFQLRAGRDEIQLLQKAPSLIPPNALFAW